MKTEVDSTCIGRLGRVGKVLTGMKVTREVGEIFGLAMYIKREGQASRLDESMVCKRMIAYLEVMLR